MSEDNEVAPRRAGPRAAPTRGTDMSTGILCDDAAAVTCGNCGWTGKGSDLHEMDDFESRVDASDGALPAGDCPECGAFAYVDEPVPESQPEPNLDPVTVLKFVAEEMNSAAEKGRWLGDLVRAAIAKADSVPEPEPAAIAACRLALADKAAAYEGTFDSRMDVDPVVQALRTALAAYDAGRAS